ncbi:cyclic nucleotide-binding domain-containing protein [bacterium]|nr:cyclic nucleotide-binding domain-containing protein [bacterium]MCI0602222.1 cyclic nucleotide-binding domain-containing protein [bacterium]
MDWRERFGVPEGLHKTTLLCAGLLFAVTAAFIILKTARDGLILSDYSANALPWFMAITTLVTAVVAATYIRLYRKLSLGPAVELSLKVFAVGSLILWAGIKARWAPATPILYVWTGVFGALAPVQSWSVITQQLLTRQAKRDLGMIGSGGILGAAAGGFFATWVVKASSVSTLLPAATILILLGHFAVQALSILGTGLPVSTAEAESPKIQRRFVVLVLLVVGIGTVVTTFADFQFKVIAQREMFTADKLAEFFGSFYAYVGLGTFLFQLFITPILMSRVGVSAALAILPLGMAFGNAWILMAGSLASAVFLKGSEQLFKHSVDRSSLEVLYMAIPDDVKVRLKSLIDTVGVRTAEGIGAVLLVLLFSIAEVPLPVVAFISIGLLAVAIVCTFFLGREYPKALTNAIQKKEVTFSSVKTTFFTTDFYNLMPELLKNSNRETLIDLLQLLSTMPGRKMKPYLEPLLDHKDAEVRLMSLQLLFKQNEDLSNKVEQMVSDPDARVRVEAIRYLCFKSSIDPLAKLAHLLMDPDPTVQAAACACSLNLDLEPAKEAAYKKLEEIMSDSAEEARPEVRLEVARILEHLKPSVTTDQLCIRLLQDPAVEVQKIALRSVSHLKRASLIPALLELVGNPSLRAEVRQTLGAYGNAVLPHMERIVNDSSESIERRKQALVILSDIEAPTIADFLMKHALGSNLVLRFVAIKALNKLRKRQRLPILEQNLDSLVEQEITALEVEFERIRFFVPHPGSVIERVLHQRQLWARERIFRALALLYEPKSIYSAYRALTGGDKRRADAALEWLDTVLRPDHRSRILALLEGTARFRNKSDSATRRAVLLGYLGAQDQLPAAALVEDLSIEELQDWQPDIENTLKIFQNQSLVEETLRWRYKSMIGDSSIQRKLSTIQKLDRLGKVDIFSELGPNELLLLANQCTEQQFIPNEVIFSEGDLAQEIFILFEGAVELRRGSGQATLIKEGESFGTLSVLGNQPRLFSAVATEKSHCLKLDRETLWDILEDYPAICHGIFKVMAQRVGSMLNALEADKVKS